MVYAICEIPYVLNLCQGVRKTKTDEVLSPMQDTLNTIIDNLDLSTKSSVDEN